MEYGIQYFLHHYKNLYFLLTPCVQESVNTGAAMAS